MIPQAFVTHWSRVVPWSSPDQVEQDLALSRLICEIANGPTLGHELVFRGGTCLHKLHMSEPLRYSEDLDYVRTTHGPIGPVFDELRAVAAAVGMRASTDIGQHPKVFFRSEFESGSGPMRIKVEINTFETSPARPHLRIPYALESPWWSGEAEVLTFEPAELMATKLRAMYQRRKGRDLFDLWLALTKLGLDPDEILACLVPYRPEGYTTATAITNLEAHLKHRAFRDDLVDLVAADSDFDIEEAAAVVTDRLLRHLG